MPLKFVCVRLGPLNQVKSRQIGREDPYQFEQTLNMFKFLCLSLSTQFSSIYDMML